MRDGTVFVVEIFKDYAVSFSLQSTKMTQKNILEG